MTQASSPVLWAPDTQRMQRSAMFRFMQQINEHYHCELDDYHALHRWSINHREYFWQELMRFDGVIADIGESAVLSAGEHMRQDQWFVDTTLNFAENLLRFRDEKAALLFADERGTRQSLSYRELYLEVARVAHWLKAAGIVPGDRVAGFAANRTETVVAMLATASIGAIWSSCSPDFGTGGILDRFSQIQPRVLFAVSSHCYAGKILDHTHTLQNLLTSLSSVEHLVLMPALYPVASADADKQQALEQTGNAARVHHWQSLKVAPDSADESVPFHHTPFNHPLYIMYSSGTTGMPKCIVHGAGGTLIQHRKEHLLHVDLSREDVFFYFTTCGWMMWNWLVSGLASGATLVLYDGSPFHPDPDVLFRLVDEFGISVMGVSAKYVSACDKAGLRPGSSHNLSSLRTILSTGSPLNAEGFDYVYRDIKSDVALNSISGGTDIISCFVLGSPLLPVRRGEIQCAGLGMDVAVFDDQGKPVIGTKGELVCRQSFPSMPIGFWNDESGTRYHRAYFERFENVWTHGDYAEQTPSGAFVIHGRSDTVLNPGGVRIGTAEIYRQVEQLPEIVESVVIGQDHKDDVRVVLFVRLADGVTLDEALIQRIRHCIRSGASPRHVPAVIRQVRDIPRTLSGKIAEIAVRDTINGKPVNNRDALANPEALDEYSALRDAQSM